MSSITLNIKGMTCGHCEKAVTQALQQVDGVERVNVSLGQSKAVVEGHPEVAALIEAVQEEGYAATAE